MAHASKSFLVFTGGEWSDQLHGRTDLAKADSAGRKVRNFVPAQTGRLFRRKGLEFVGAALGECLAGDPRFAVPSWEGLTAAETISPPASVYGTLGMEALRTSEDIGPIWQVCDYIAYCDGPVAEGQTMSSYADRYQTRWVAKLEDGNVFYRRFGTGEPWTQVPSELIPQPNTNMLGLGFAFDANARPCFASQIGADIHLWRWQATVPQEYTFTGTSPRLVFTGVIQPENSKWDVVCYYCKLGDVVVSFQRENFATAYTLFSDPDYYFTRVKVADFGTGDSAERIHIAAVGPGGLLGLFRSPLYNPWPFFVTDSGTTSATLEGIGYDLLIVECGTYQEQGAQGGSIEEIVYLAVTVPVTQDPELGTAVAAIESIAYPQVAIVCGTYQEAGEAIGTVESINYPVVSVNAGTYQEAATSTATLESISYV